ncbi:MAG: flippase-like domain-containing protein [bacterium]|nr:flippase-like domain-containing protein [bacterium]
MNKSAKKHFFVFLRILIAVVLLGYLLLKVDIQRFWEQLQSARFSLMCIGVLLYAVTAYLAIIRWKVLLQVHSVILTFSELTKLFFVGLFFNNAMPGLTGGDIIKAYYVARHTAHNKTEAVATVFIDRIIGIFALFVIGIITLMFNLKNPDFRKIALFLTIVFISILVFLAIFFNKHLLKKIPFLLKIIDLFPFKDMLIRIYEAFYKYKSHPYAVVYSLVLSILLQGVFIFIVSLFGIALSLDVHFLHYFLFIPIISTISALPVSISGLGVSEQLYVYCFGLVGAQSEGSLALALMARLILVIWSLPGWYFYMTMGELKVSEETMEKEIIIAGR